MSLLGIAAFGRTAAFRALNLEGWLFELSLKRSSASCRLGVDHTPLEITSQWSMNRQVGGSIPGG